MFANRYLLRLSVMMCLVCLVAPPHGTVAAVREPVWAGRFYPADREDLDRLVHRLIAAAEREATAGPPRPALRALIIPHAGYAYSGPTAAHAARVIPPDQFKRVVLLGPDHRVGFTGAALTGASEWQTPLGMIPIGDCSGLAEFWPEMFTVISASDRLEHSLEVTLPFIQARLAQFELIPLVLGPCDAKKMARAITSLIQEPSTLLVVSADLSHYLPHGAAVDRDRQTLDRILALDFDWEKDQDNRTCGRYPVGVLLELARQHHWQPVLLHTSTSGDRTGDKEAVVGYAAVAFYGDEPMHDQSENHRRLTPRQGAALVSLARQTLARHFGQRVAPAEGQALEELLEDPALQARCGTFVTLKINSQLRGCIGSLSASTTIVSGVRDNALNAAFHDPRFSPLTKKELDLVHIEVSVLSEPVPLGYHDADDLLAKLKPGIDGVIIKKGYATATFLPQVWEQLPQPEQFLSHLCLKAGLAAGGWRKGDLEVRVYQVQYFEETR